MNSSTNNYENEATRLAAYLLVGAVFIGEVFSVASTGLDGNAGILMLTLLSFFALGLLLIIFKASSKRWYKQRNYVLIQFVLMLGIIIGLGNVAAFGWDALDHWLKTSADLLSGTEQSASAVMGRHPQALSGLWAAAAIGRSWVGEFSFPLLFIQFIPVMTTVIALQAYCRTSKGKLWCFLFMLTGLPLYENHIYIIGYSEIWLGSALILLVRYWSIVAGDAASYETYVWIILVSAAAIIIRNTGFLFVILISICAVGTIFISASNLAGNSFSLKRVFAKRHVAFALTLLVCVGVVASGRSSTFFLDITEGDDLSLRVDCRGHPCSTWQLNYVAEYYLSPKSGASQTRYEKLKFPGRKIENGVLRFNNCDSPSTCSLVINKPGFSYSYARVTIREKNGRPVFSDYIFNGFRIEFDALNSGLIIGHFVRLKIAGRADILDFKSVIESSSGFFWGVFSNSSFSILFSFFLVAVFLLISRGNYEKSTTAKFLFRQAAVTSLFICFGGLFSPYLTPHVVGGGDATFSRTLLVALLLWAPCAVSLLQSESFKKTVLVSHQIN